MTTYVFFDLERRKFTSIYVVLMQDLEDYSSCFGDGDTSRDIFGKKELFYARTSK